MSMLKNPSQLAAKAGTTRAIAAPVSAYGPKLSMGLACPEKGRTKQSFKDECDINSIMAKYQKTGVLDFTRKNEPRYGDCVGHEFNSAMLVVAQGKTMFHELPSSIRAFFENDPARFLDFVDDPDNYSKMAAMGLLIPAEPRKADPKGTAPKTDEAAVKAAEADLRASARKPGPERSGEFPQHGNDHARDPKTGRFLDE